MEKSVAEKLNKSDVLEKGDNHAMNMTDAKKVSYVLPVLEKMKQNYNAREVFFENVGYTEGEAADSFISVSWQRGCFS